MARITEEGHVITFGVERDASTNVMIYRFAFHGSESEVQTIDASLPDSGPTDRRFSTKDGLLLYTLIPPKMRFRRMEHAVQQDRGLVLSDGFDVYRH